MVVANLNLSVILDAGTLRVLNLGVFLSPSRSLKTLSPLGPNSRLARLKPRVETSTVKLS